MRICIWDYLRHGPTDGPGAPRPRVHRLRVLDMCALESQGIWLAQREADRRGFSAVTVYGLSRERSRALKTLRRPEVWAPQNTAQAYPPARSSSASCVQREQVVDGDVGLALPAPRRLGRAFTLFVQRAREQIVEVVAARRVERRLLEVARVALVLQLRHEGRRLLEEAAPRHAGEPRVRVHLRAVRPAVRLRPEQLRDQVAQLGVEHAAHVDVARLDGLQHRVGRAAAAEGVVADDHLVQQHARRVVVDGVGRRLAAKHFGRGVRQGAAAPAAPPAGGEAEVGELDVAGGGDEDVGRLDVAVDDAGVVEVEEAGEDLGEVEACGGVVEEAAAEQQRRDVAARHELDREVVVARRLEGVEAADEEGAGVPHQDGGLDGDADVLLAQVALAHRLDRVHVARRRLAREPHLREAARAEAAQQREVAEAHADLPLLDHLLVRRAERDDVLQRVHLLREDSLEEHRGGVEEGAPLAPADEAHQLAREPREPREPRGQRRVRLVHVEQRLRDLHQPVELRGDAVVLPHRRGEQRAHQPHLRLLQRADERRRLLLRVRRLVGELARGDARRRVVPHVLPRHLALTQPAEHALAAAAA
eukprot:CAMPEP_0195654846 /NCGR_PEP_ID=MMETSP0815-20121206/34135_1 /TAXON_ID=97485 /ORGANISM="Prymnesium parvum, Strain Texoma1" /LENGTH=590 /DNA_ID=CAMNT_0040799079 /DNA_START=211 /DNA_END=1981 /DNA_ORIENTATION=+